LRDLIQRLDNVAQNHAAYPQAADAMKHLRDHLSALARCEEINRSEAPPRPKPPPSDYKPIEPGAPRRYLR
jgi:hypothetical protein